MRKHTATQRTEHGDREAETNLNSRHLELAGEAVLAGLTREQVIAQLVSRIRRDEGYLAYRKACNRRTRYDEQVTSDLCALALAAVWLEAGPPSQVPTKPVLAWQPPTPRPSQAKAARRLGVAGRVHAGGAARARRTGTAHCCPAPAPTSAGGIAAS
jgi:hypothetical protein